MKREYASKDGSVRIVETPTDVLRSQNFIYGIKIKIQASYMLNFSNRRYIHRIL